MLFRVAVTLVGIAAGALGSGAIQGVVVDSSGAPVGQAVVTVQDVNQFVAAVLPAVGANGEFEIRDLRPGQYTMTARHPRLSSARTAIAVRDGETLAVRLVLRVAPVAAEVTVTAESARVDSLESCSTNQRRRRGRD